LLALLAGCNSTRPVQPKPIVIERHVEPQAPDDANYVAPQGMSRAQVYAMLEERSRATDEALEAKERQKRQVQQRRRRSDRLNIYLGAPLYWRHGYYGPYYHGHCWPWHGHHHGGVYLRTW